MTDFEAELSTLLAKHGKDQRCQVPPFMLARYLTESLKAFTLLVCERDRWKLAETRR